MFRYSVKYAAEPEEQPRPVTKPYYTVSELHNKFGVNQKTVYRWHKEDILNVLVKRYGSPSGKRYLVLHDDWEKFRRGIFKGETEPHLSASDIVREIKTTKSVVTYWLRAGSLKGRQLRTGPWRIPVSEWERFKKTMLTDDFVTTFDIANECKVKPKTVLRWIAEGKLKAYRRYSEYRIHRAEYERFKANLSKGDGGNKSQSPTCLSTSIKTTTTFSSES